MSDNTTAAVLNPFTYASLDPSGAGEMLDKANIWKQQEEAAKEARRVQRRQEMGARRIAAEASTPLEESATFIPGGMDTAALLGTLGLTTALSQEELKRRQSLQQGSTTRQGQGGTPVTSQLGFGG